MRVKRDNDRLNTKLMGTISDEGEKVTVTKVNAVVDANRHDTPRRTKFLNGPTHNDHGRDATGRR